MFISSNRVKTCKYMLTLKVHWQNLTSGQGHVMSHVEPIGHISYQSMQEKQIWTTSSALYPFYKKLETKNEFDLIWPRMTRSRERWVKTEYRSSRVAYFKNILRSITRSLPTFGKTAFEHFVIALYWSGLRIDLTSGHRSVTLRHTLCRYWCPYQLQKVWYWYFINDKSKSKDTAQS